MKRLFVIVLLCLSPGTAALAAQPAGAASLSDCTAHNGTIVAVNYGHWGGPMVIGCGVDQKSGYNLLHAAGFTTAGDLHDGPAFICRLGDKVFRHGTQYPTSRQDPCVVTPPASAYWSYWLALSGQDHWSYSQLGAMGNDPKPGEVELWTFGATNIAGTHRSGDPTFTPEEVRAYVNHHNSGNGTGAPKMVSAEVTHVSDSAGSPRALIIGICLAVLLGVAAGWTVLRRRRYE